MSRAMGARGGVADEGRGTCGCTGWLHELEVMRYTTSDRGHNSRNPFFWTPTMFGSAREIVAGRGGRAAGSRYRLASGLYFEEVRVRRTPLDTDTLSNSNLPFPLGISIS